MTQDKDATTEDMSKRDKAVIGTAIVIMLAPFMLFIIFMMLQSIDLGSSKDWTLLAALFWFVFADLYLDSAALRRRAAPWLGRFDTATIRKRLIKAITIAPLFGFCFIDESKTGWAAFGDWALGCLAGLITFPIVDAATDAIGRKWVAWRKSRRRRA